MCLYPRLIKNRKYIPNKKNGGIAPEATDKRVLSVPVGCGKCMECRKQKAKGWQVRLLEDVREKKNGIFVTLTFSNESIKELGAEIKELTGYNRDNAIAKLGVRRFLERWRKEHKKSVRHWLVTELGHNGTENIHLHGIIWTDKAKEEIKKHWKYGYTWEGEYVSEKTVNYITKYITKQDLKHKEYEAIILSSAGIGASYIERQDAKNNKYTKGETKEYYKTRTGHKMALPIYYRNKIYKDEEREELWKEKLDKLERYVNGVKVSIKEGTQKYFKALKEARKINKTLGYGNNEKNWERIEYEKQQRELNYNKRKGGA